MNILPACVFGVGAGATAAVALLLIFSTICTLSSDPYKLITPLSICANAVSFFICGFCTARRCKGALPSGALSGVLLAICFWIASLFLDNSMTWGLSVTVELLLRASYVVVCIFGAIIGKARG